MDWILSLSLSFSSTEWTAADSSYTSSFPFDDHDYDQILTPPIVRSGIASDPDSSYNPPLLNTASTEAITTQETTTSISPSQHSYLWPPPQTISEQTPAATQVAAFWVTGNWSSVSLIESIPLCSCHTSRTTYLIVLHCCLFLFCSILVTADI